MGNIRLHISFLVRKHVQVILISFLSELNANFIFFSALDCVYSLLKVHRSSALIFHKRNKNCFIFIFIISNNLRFKWNSLRQEAGLVLLKINIMCSHDIMKDKNCTNLLSYNKIKSMKYAEN